MAAVLDPLRLRHPAVDAALAAAATLLGMEVVFVSGFRDETYRFERVWGGHWPGLVEGRSIRRVDSLCELMLSSGVQRTCAAPEDPLFAGSPSRAELGVVSYVGVPIRNATGQVLGTLCGVDRRRVEVSDTAVTVLGQLAEVIAGHLAGGAPQTDVVLRRTASGWTVGDGQPAPDLTSAMVLADLLGADLSPPGRPSRPTAELSEVDRLRLAVHQLEHALTARVTVEQAIGVLSERLGTSPRESFEQLRRVARRSGRRVHELSQKVVRSAVEPGTGVPPELAGGGSVPAAQPRPSDPDSSRQR